jgi:hypothetical protein
MLPVMIQGGHPPARAVAPHLVLKLKAGWTFDPERRVFVSQQGRRFVPRVKLPRGSRIIHMVPGLAKAAQKSLSRHERNLARYLQLILPRRTDPAAYIETLRKWDCLAEVRRAPEIDLPSQPC